MKYALKWFLFSLAFVPLLVNLDTLFPFIFTKTLLIRSAITLFWVFFSIWYFTQRKAANEVIENNWRFVKNPLYIAIALFMILMVFSTIFAVNPYKAFFGDIERGEGLLGIFHFFGFFVASLLVFKKEDWATFFRFSLITGAILLVDSLGEFITGEFGRAQSFIGNPTFLAGYFLFIIFSALVSFSMSKNRIGWRVFSFAMIFGGIVGLFLTGTRGAILGFGVGALLSILYFSIKGRGVKIAGFDLQRLGITFLIFAILGLGALILTKDSLIWQKIPGVNRLVTISFVDNTVQTRLISAGVSINSVMPAENGIHRFLIGYGPDNFNIAYNKYYNPEYMKYENLWFDRAHNKIFDVLVMDGALGLLAYLAMWFFLFSFAFKKIKEKEYAVPIIFFGSAYFVQNLFVFDQISTWVPFFAFFAFAVFVASGNGEEIVDRGPSKIKDITGKLLKYKLPIVAVFFAYSLVMYTLVPYFQSVAFIQILKGGGPQFILDSVERFSEPYNYAQATIRNRFLVTSQSVIGNPDMTEIVNTAIMLQEEFVSREPYDPRDINLLSNTYRIKANLGEPGAYEKSLEYAFMALELSPKRQDHLYTIASLYADRSDFVKMQEYAGTMLSDSPDVARTKILYSTVITREGPVRYAEAMTILNSAVGNERIRVSNENEIGVLRSVYNLYLGHFRETRDEENFLATIDGLIELETNLDNRDWVPNTLTSEKLVGLRQLRESFLSGGWNAVAL